MTPIVIFNSNPTTFNEKDANGEWVMTEKAMSMGVGGGHIRGQGNQEVFTLTDTIGFDEILALAYIVDSSYEEIFGYNRQVVDGNGVPQWEDEEETIPTMEEVPNVPAMTARYNAAYNPAVNGGARLMGIPGGYNDSHLVVS